MNVTTSPGVLMDMVHFHIRTGAVYNGPQTVVARLEKAESMPESGIWRLVFSIADDSRCMYEKVEVFVTWPCIEYCQNNTKTTLGVERMANRIMEEYLSSWYVTE